MSDESTDLTAFEHSLAAVHPHPGLLQRDALLFAAGRAAGRRGRFWPTVAGVLTLVCVGLGGTLLLRPPSVVEVERVVLVPAPAPPPLPVPVPEPVPSAQPHQPLVSAPLPPEWLEGLHLRESMLRNGISAMPATVWVDQPPPKTDPIPNLSALRLNANPAPGDQLP